MTRTETDLRTGVMGQGHAWPQI